MGGGGSQTHYLNLMLLAVVGKSHEQSKQEQELLESLEELRDLNKRQTSVDYDIISKNLRRNWRMNNKRKMKSSSDKQNLLPDCSLSAYLPVKFMHRHI